ncbi:hypothetical protein pb186bvf_001567 [Paramecium bursaria]
MQSIFNFHISLQFTCNLSRSHFMNNKQMQTKYLSSNERKKIIENHQDQ